MIDKITVDRILNAADIVDVVSDFVTLKRRGTSWVGYVRSTTTAIRRSM